MHGDEVFPGTWAHEVAAEESVPHRRLKRLTQRVQRQSRQQMRGPEGQPNPPGAPILQT